MSVDVFNVVFQGINTQQIRAALNSAPNRTGFVIRKIQTMLLLQQVKNSVDAANVLRHRVLFGERFSTQALFGILNHCVGDSTGWQDHVDDTRRLGVQRHPIEFRRSFVLGDNQSTSLVDVSNTARAVASGARQDDADGVAATIVSQGSKELVNGM